MKKTAIVAILAVIATYGINKIIDSGVINSDSEDIVTVNYSEGIENGEYELYNFIEQMQALEIYYDEEDTTLEDIMNTGYFNSSEEEYIKNLCEYTNTEKEELKENLENNRGNEGLRDTVLFDIPIYNQAENNTGIEETILSKHQKNMNSIHESEEEYYIGWCNQDTIDRYYYNTGIIFKTESNIDYADNTHHDFYTEMFLNSYDKNTIEVINAIFSSTVPNKPERLSNINLEEKDFNIFKDGNLSIEIISEKSTSRNNEFTTNIKEELLGNHDQIHKTAIKAVIHNKEYIYNIGYNMIEDVYSLVNLHLTSYPGTRIGRTDNNDGWAIFMDEIEIFHLEKGKSDLLDAAENLRNYLSKNEEITVEGITKNLFNLAEKIDEYEQSYEVFTTRTLQRKLGN